MALPVIDNSVSSIDAYKNIQVYLDKIEGIEKIFKIEALKTHIIKTFTDYKAGYLLYAIRMCT